MKTLQVKSELREIDKVRKFMRRVLRGLELTEEDGYKVELSLVEMCTNIVRYAYPESRGNIYIRTWHEDACLYLELRMTGSPSTPGRSKSRPCARC